MSGAFLRGRIVETIGTNREENFPAKRTSALEAPRFPQSHGHQGRTPSAPESASSRALEAIRLIEPLRSRGSFAALSKYGRRRQGQWCWVRYASVRPGDSTGPDDGADVARHVDRHVDHGVAHGANHIPQVGYAIGKNVGSAVVRNRIRRRLRPILLADDTDLPAGLYLIGVKNDAAATISHEMLRDDLRATLAAAVRASRS